MNQMKISKILKLFSMMNAIIGGLFFFWYMPHIISDAAIEFSEVSFLEMPGKIGIWTIALLCYIALYYFWKICNEIGKENSFCEKNVLSMKYIGIIACLICILIFGGDVYMAVVGYLHPGLVILSFLFIFVGSGIAVICFSLSALIKNAVMIKNENDLTI